MKEIEISCTRQALSLLGKSILNVRYMSEEEANDMMWHKRPIVIVLNDGSFLIPQADDEGNNGGALWYQDKGNDKIICTI
jgi:hypothetical protein